jgi:hypothetical protein
MKNSSSRRIVIASLALATLLAVGTYVYLARTSLPPGLATTTNASATAAFDHSALDALLARHVSNARVNYAAWKSSPEDLAALDAYLARLAAADLGGLDQSERLAFFINAYNAITIRSILDAYPVASIRDIVGVWKVRTWRVAGGEITLDQIEHRILRRDFQDPRIHFAIVCASKGCPPIQPWAFTGDRIDSQLQTVAESFLNDPARTRLDLAAKRMTLSPILEWFSEDFVKKSGSMPAFVLAFRKDVTAASGNEWRADFADYDWTLNE